MKLKWIDSIIGKISWIDTKNKLTYKEAIKKIPKTARIMKAWEVLRLIDEDFNSLKDIPKHDYYFTYAREKYYRASRLYRFDDVSGFLAVGLGVDFDLPVRGVLVVKKDEK